MTTEVMYAYKLTAVYDQKPSKGIRRFGAFSDERAVALALNILKGRNDHDADTIILEKVQLVRAWGGGGSD